MPSWLQAPFRLARRLYEGVEAMAQHPAALVLLIVVALSEAIFFPIPPDVLLIPMAVARPRRALFYGTVCLAASVTGGMIGYWLGATMMDSVGTDIVRLYNLGPEVDRIKAWYLHWDAWIVAIAGFSPLPYKLFTLTSGAAEVSPVIFVIASIIGRGARFYLITGLISIFGDRAAEWIDRHFNTLTVILVVLILAVVVWSTV